VEPATRNAFVELLSRRRLVGGKPEDRLTEMFRESVAAAGEITEALGVQVRRAVELLVQALSESALDAVDHGELDPLPAARSQVYEAAVTVMMRVVFLLFAEERGLLPQGRLFAAGYGISEELDALDRRARTEGSEALDATHLTWHRLLATSLALYRGASFEDLRLPSYGGSLFDPDRFAFLTARSERGPLSVTVSDRVMLEVLRAVQVAQLKGQPARQISFRDIDVEQIGYIYEGLLGYSCADVDEVTVGLIGKPGRGARVVARRAGSASGTAPRRHRTCRRHPGHGQGGPARGHTAVEAGAGQGHPDERSGRGRRARAAGRHHRRRAARPAAAVRRDHPARPARPPAGRAARRAGRGGDPSRATAGAHYTPRSLAEEVVRYALEPLVFDPGPHQKPDSADWVPLSSDRLLDLKIADIACGSGAFLVAAARYLAARLVEAWHREHAATGTPHELYTQAIRKVVATCLYGADINAMAVEMCKLSLWLVSLDPKLPFSFVDDKVLHGSSLLGLTDVRQLQYQHIDPDAAKSQMMLSDLDVDGVLARAVRLRKALASEVDDADPQRSATTKRRQWREYQELTAQLADVADGVIAAGLRLGGKPGRTLTEAYENLQVAVGKAYPGSGEDPDRSMLDGILAAGLTPTVETDYERWRPLHWILAVPDVMEKGGFDAVIGNPPFLGGQKLRGAGHERARLAGQRAGDREAKAAPTLSPTSSCTPRPCCGTTAPSASSRPTRWPRVTPERSGSTGWWRAGSASCGRSRAGRGLRPARTSSTPRCGEPAGTSPQVFSAWPMRSSWRRSRRSWSLPAGWMATRCGSPRTPVSHLSAATCSAWASCSTRAKPRSGSTRTRRMRRSCFPTSTVRTSTPGRTRRRPAGSSTSTTAPKLLPRSTTCRMSACLTVSSPSARSRRSPFAETTGGSTRHALRRCDARLRSWVR